MKRKVLTENSAVPSLQHWKAQSLQKNNFLEVASYILGATVNRGKRLALAQHYKFD